MEKHEVSIENRVNGVADEVRTESGLGRRMAKWSALGAVVAIPVPIVGPIFGAIAGAAYGYHRHHKRT